MTITPPDRVGMAQGHLSRRLEEFKRRWQPDFKTEIADADEREYLRRCERRDFEVELTNVVQSAFMAAQAPFAIELDAFRQHAWSARLLQYPQFSPAVDLAKFGVSVGGDS